MRYHIGALPTSRNTIILHRRENSQYLLGHDSHALESAPGALVIYVRHLFFVLSLKVSLPPVAALDAFVNIIDCWNNLAYHASYKVMGHPSDGKLLSRQGSTLAGLSMSRGFLALKEPSWSGHSASRDSTPKLPALSSTPSYVLREASLIHFISPDVVSRQKGNLDSAI